MESLARDNWHVQYISIFRTFCTPTCPLFVAPETPMLFDTDHFTPEASRLLVKSWHDAHLLQ